MLGLNKKLTNTSDKLSDQHAVMLIINQLAAFVGSQGKYLRECVGGIVQGRCPCPCAGLQVYTCRGYDIVHHCLHTDTHTETWHLAS